MSRMASFIGLLAVVLVFGVLFYRIISGFLLPLFFALLLVVIFRPLYVWLTQRTRGRERLAALLTTLAVMVIVLAPFTWIITLATIEGVGLITHLNVATIPEQFEEKRKEFGLDLPYGQEMRRIEKLLIVMIDRAESGNPPQAEQSRALVALIDDLKSKLLRAGDAHDRDLMDRMEQSVKQASNATELYDYELALLEAERRYRAFRASLLGGPIRAWLRETANPTEHNLRGLSSVAFSAAQRWLVPLGGATTALVGGFLLGLTITTVAFYFFLIDGGKMVATLMRLSPIDDQHEQKLVDEFASVSRAVVLATLLSAVAQGLLGGIGYWAAGLNSVFLLTLLTSVLALVPFVGAAAVWVPAALWLFFVEDRVLAAILLAAYGFGVISMADNFIKPLVLQGRSKLHPLLALLSVIGGVQALGPSGIVVGPMVVVFLQTLLNILHDELLTFGQDQDAGQEAPAAERSAEAAAPTPTPDASARDGPQPAAETPGQADPPEDEKDRPPE